VSAALARGCPWRNWCLDEAAHVCCFWVPRLEYAHSRYCVFPLFNSVGLLGHLSLMLE
jgi:hypothetical protein